MAGSGGSGLWGKSARTVKGQQLLPSPPPLSMPDRFFVEASTESRDTLSRYLQLDRPVTNKDIAGLVGALDGAHIDVSVKPSGSVSIVVDHQHYVAERLVYEDDSYLEKSMLGDPMSDSVDSYFRDLWAPDPSEDSATIIENESFYTKKGAPAGIGTKVLARQVAAAAELGIKKIILYAADGWYLSKETGQPEAYNGYYTWPRLGFDGPIDDNARDSMPAHLRSVTNMISLFSMPGGPEWWKANGTGFRGVFDPTPDSPSRQALQDYLDVKGIDPYAPFP